MPASDLPRRKPLNRGYVLKCLDLLHAAIDAGQVPAGHWRATAPDYENDRVAITIFPDDEEFRSAVAAVLPEGSYTIHVSDIRGYG